MGFRPVFFPASVLGTFFVQLLCSFGASEPPKTLLLLSKSDDFQKITFFIFSFKFSSKLMLFWTIFGHFGAKIGEKGSQEEVPEKGWKKEASW